MTTHPFTHKLATRVALPGLLALLTTLPAWADRCSANADGKWTCTYQERNHAYASNSGGSCSGLQKLRKVRWQVPEGTPPAGGWPVVFYFNGTVIAGSNATAPFTSTSTSFGADQAEIALHEYLDNPSGQGRKYAVIAPEAPTFLGVQFWDTNQGSNYTGKNDYCFLPDLFKAVSEGRYGPASQFNMTQRYAVGISSGGYNTSRMAVSFNEDSTWRALAIVSGSYATCAGPLCSVPATLPANHPPTKFYHGTADFIVPIGTMRTYFNRLDAQGIEVEKVEHKKGHMFTPDILGETGAKAWFDRH